jgi:hypothetical protein
MIFVFDVLCAVDFRAVLRKKLIDRKTMYVV